MNRNDATIKSYELNADKYTKGRTQDQANFAVWYKWIVDDISHAPNQGVIFEIGSGPGYFADYLEELGYKIIRSEAAQSFIDFSTQRGKTMKKFNVALDDFPDQYAIILAINVMQHLPKNEAIDSFGKVYDALEPGGRFIFTITTDDGSEEWRDDKGGNRYFYNWVEVELLTALNEIGFKVIRNEVSGYKKWRNITVEKP